MFFCRTLLLILITTNDQLGVAGTLGEWMGYRIERGGLVFGFSGLCLIFFLRACSCVTAACILGFVKRLAILVGLTSLQLVRLLQTFARVGNQCDCVGSTLYLHY